MAAVVQNAYHWEMNPKYVANQMGRKFKEEYEMKEELGKGGFGTVMRCIYRSGQKKVELAAKINNAPNKKQAQIDEAVISRDLTGTLAHLNLVNIFDSIIEGDIVYNMYEMATGGDLSDLLKEKVFFSEVEAAVAIKQILDGVHHMHKQGYIHRDLKPQNILVQSKGLQVYKVTDYGLCCKRQRDPFNLNHPTAVYVPHAHGNAGTPLYRPPESGADFDTDFDIWSCGVILYQLLAGYQPFIEGDQAKLDVLLREIDYTYPDPEWIGLDNARDMISHMIAPLRIIRQAVDVYNQRVTQYRNYPQHYNNPGPNPPHILKAPHHYYRRDYTDLITHPFYMLGAAQNIPKKPQDSILQVYTARKVVKQNILRQHWQVQTGQPYYAQPHQQQSGPSAGP